LKSHSDGADNCAQRLDLFFVEQNINFSFDDI